MNWYRNLATINGIALSGRPFVDEHRVEDAVSPGSVGVDVVAEPALLREAELFDDGDRGGIVRTDGRGDPVQSELVEAEPDEGADSVGGVATAPVINMNGVAELCGLDTTEAKTSEADQGVVCVNGKVDLGTRFVAGAIEDAGEHGAGLLGTLGVEGQVVGDAGVADQPMNSLAVVRGELAERDSGAGEVEGVEGHGSTVAELRQKCG